MRSRQKIRAYAAAAVMLFFAAPLRAQNAPCLRRAVVANVVDEKGNPVPGFTAADFQAKFRGKPVKILSATFDQQPRRIVILLDTSGSMRDFLLGKWFNGIGISTILDLPASPKDAYIFATFSEEFHQKTDSSRDPKAVRQALAGVETDLKAFREGKGRTACWDSMLKALAIFGSPQFGDVMYAVTDGGDNKSRSSLRYVERALLEAGVRVFVIAPLEPIGSRPTTEEEEGPRDLEQLVKATGGNLVETSRRSPFWDPPAPATLFLSPDELKGAVSMLFHQVDAFYRLEVALPQEADKLRDWDLKFADEKSARKKHLVLLYQRKIAPCVTAAP